VKSHGGICSSRPSPSNKSGEDDRDDDLLAAAVAVCEDDGSRGRCWKGVWNGGGRLTTELGRTGVGAWMISECGRPAMGERALVMDVDAVVAAVVDDDDDDDCARVWGR
jgi:hypothetical protein